MLIFIKNQVILKRNDIFSNPSFHKITLFKQNK